MKPIVLAALLASLAGSATAQEVARTEMTRAPVPGSDNMEVITFRVIVPPGARLPLHTHPGDEHAVILKGGPVIRADGSEAVLPDGIAFLFPEDMVHGGLTAAGDAPVEMVTVFVVRTGEPAMVLAE